MNCPKCGSGNISLTYNPGTDMISMICNHCGYRGTVKLRPIVALLVGIVIGHVWWPIDSYQDVEGRDCVSMCLKISPVTDTEKTK